VQTLCTPQQIRGLPAAGHPTKRSAFSFAALPVNAAAAEAKCSFVTAIDHDSMARDICEVIISNELLSDQFAGPSEEVQVDVCFLT